MGQALPGWARVLAASLPRTTAGMLELDYLQRTKNPLPPILRAKVRWIAARTNRCAYSGAYAASDLRRAYAESETLRRLGLGDAERQQLADAELRALAEGSKDQSPLERVVTAFARKLTLEAYAVTDAEFEELTRLLGEEELSRQLGDTVVVDRDKLVRALGERQAVAVVLLLAYASFQDRMVLALHLPVEDGGPLPPHEFRFRKEAVTPAARSARPVHPDLAGTNDADAARLALNFDQLQQRMEQQRTRPPRIRVPTWDEVVKNLPAERRQGRPMAIRWSLVCFGYQPELTAAWLGTMATFGQEARQDRVFEESLFWVITRETQCFY